MPAPVQTLPDVHHQVHHPEHIGGPAVVLLHGLGSCGDDWPLQLSPLEPFYRVITLDLPGHGQSRLPPGWTTVRGLAAPVAALLERLEEPPAHIVGLSLGGAVALQLAVDWPARVRSLIIVNSFARMPHLSAGNGRALVRITLLLFGPMSLVGKWIAAGLFPGEDQAMLRQVAAERIAANRRGAYLRLLSAAARFDLRPRLAEVSCPALIVAGDRDATVPLEAKVELQARIPGARIEIVPDSGHATPLDAHDAFNALLLGFLHEVDQKHAA
jgi:pimeloyl-ACP methyl ester carboxylesterase